MPRIPFNSANAREMALRSHAPTSRRHLPKPERAKQTPFLADFSHACDPFLRQQAKKIRAEVTRLLDLQSSLTKASDIYRMSSAIDKLLRQERELTMRYAPGTVKPPAAKTSTPFQPVTDGEVYLIHPPTPANHDANGAGQ